MATLQLIYYRFRLVDIFIGLSALLNKSSRLFKVLKMLGLEDVNNVYMRR